MPTEWITNATTSTASAGNILIGRYYPVQNFATTTTNYANCYTYTTTSPRLIIPDYSTITGTFTVSPEDLEALRRYCVVTPEEVCWPVRQEICWPDDFADPPDIEPRPIGELWDLLGVGKDGDSVSE